MIENNVDDRRRGGAGARLAARASPSPKPEVNLPGGLMSDLHKPKQRGMLPGMAGITAALRAALKSCGHSRYAVSKATGIPESTLSRFAGGKPLRGENIDKLADHLGLSLMKKPGAARKGR